MTAIISSFQPTSLRNPPAARIAPWATADSACPGNGQSRKQPRQIYIPAFWLAAHRSAARSRARQQAVTRRGYATSTGIPASQPHPRQTSANTRVRATRASTRHTLHSSSGLHTDHGGIQPLEQGLLRAAARGAHGGDSNGNDQSSSSISPPPLPAPVHTCTHPVTAPLLTMTIILTQIPNAELRAGPGKHQQAEPEPRGRNHGRQRVLVGRGAVEHL